MCNVRFIARACDHELSAAASLLVVVFTALVMERPTSSQQYGNEIHYGDASRVDLLRAASRSSRAHEIGNGALRRCERKSWLQFIIAMPKITRWAG
ncbi:MAG: hypothetical protein FWD69_01995 [Polyangiaceae bacterium]|nr:hypothetical protein [Polyangiaceae bacterium]